MRDIKPEYVTLHFIPAIPSEHHQPSLPRHIPLTHPIKQATHPPKQNVPIKNHWIGMKKETRTKPQPKPLDSPRRRDQE
jgi:hypothetical protein